MKDSIVADKSKVFALHIIQLYRHLTTRECDREFVLSKQLLRSGTSIGANIKEGLRAQTRPDFILKMNIALKEASESEYWLELLEESNYIGKDTSDALLEECRELIKMLVSIVKTTKENL
ncbi:MAG: four helix bundle protein [Bacteroidales bacterium]|nr:four helix bundle protein [Candidatus Physcousia equi]